MPDEQRDHPRIKKSLAVELIGAEGTTYHAVTHDVSKTGIQLLCDGATVEGIFGSLRPNPSRRPSVELNLRLMHPESGSARFRVMCKAVFSRRLSEQEYRIGLRFESIPEAARAILNAFVDDCLDPD
jgi:c-di-GMP-binding flagellar brake protein YcgR